MDKLKNIFEMDDGKERCKGRVYSHRLSLYIGSRNEFCIKRVFTPLKRLSCPGCERCGGLDDMIADEVEAGGIPYPDHLKDGDAVILTVINDGRGFEDLYDECHLEFKKWEKPDGQ